jgi:hypothetical protein
MFSRIEEVYRHGVALFADVPMAASVPIRKIVASNLWI